MEILKESLSPIEVRPSLFPRIRMPRWPKITAILLLAAVSLQAGGNETLVDEYQLKAVFLFNFARFVEWPASALNDARDPFVICVVGENPFGSSLDDIVHGKTVANRPITIRAVSNAQQARACEILFVSASERKRERILLAALKNSSVLTVGDTDDFTANGGIVQFRVIDARVRIEIDTAAAERANLRISSKLLSLADPARH
jgi:hypothetical protein